MPQPRGSLPPLCHPPPPHTHPPPPAPAQIPPRLDGLKVYDEVGDEQVLLELALAWGSAVKVGGCGGGGGWRVCGVCVCEKWWASCECDGGGGQAGLVEVAR